MGSAYAVMLPGGPVGPWPCCRVTCFARLGPGWSASY